MKETSVKRVLILSVSITLCLHFVAGGAGQAGESRATWQVEWEKTLKAAEAEGEVTVYVVDYPRFTVSQFQKAYPKIKLNLVDGPSGPALSSRLMAERRAGKYQADLYIGGQGTHVSVLYPAKALAPMPPAFMLPEVKDESKWFKRKHRFVDPETRHSFVFQGHRGLYLRQHPASEDGRNQIVVGPYKPEVEGENYRLRPIHCRRCPQCSLVPLHE